MVGRHFIRAILLITDAKLDIRSKTGNSGKLVLKSSNVLDRRTGKPFSLEFKRDSKGCSFMSDEDRNEFVEAVAAHQNSGGHSLQLRSFMDGFWELIRRKDIFYAYTQSDIQKFVGGVSEVERFVIYIYISNSFRFGSASLVLIVFLQDR